MSDQGDLGTVPTLRKRVTRLRISEHSDPSLYLSSGCSRIVLHADIIEIEGTIRWPGCDVQVLARLVEPVGTTPAVLDVSGAAAEPHFGPEDPAAAAGTGSAPNGADGAAGGAGGNGGSVAMCVGRFTGPVLIKVDGSDGGDAQRGGDGAQPDQPPAGVDGVFNKAKWPARGPHGGRVLAKANAFHAYVSWARGATGSPGIRGGNAGASGVPGDGGSAGLIHIVVTGADFQEPITSAIGGRAGNAATPANPGAGGKPGLGGKNRLYWYNVGATLNELVADSTDSRVKNAANKHNVTARAPSGAAAPGPGEVPDSPIAVDGEPSTPSIRQVSPTDVEPQDGDLELFELVVDRAERDRDEGAHDLAQARFDWVLGLIADRTGPVATALQSRCGSLQESS